MEDHRKPFPFTTVTLLGVSLVLLFIYLGPISVLSIRIEHTLFASSCHGKHFKDPILRFPMIEATIMKPQ